MNKEPISILLLATLPDNGIKSLGSKSLFKLTSNRLLIDYQLDNIKAAMKDRDYDITFLCGFDCHRIQKNLYRYDDKFPIKIIKQNHSNLNFGGALLKGIQEAKYDNIVSINYGCLFSKSVISQLIYDTSANTLAISKKNRHNDNIKLGCHIEDKEIVNIFFDLGQYKYLDINFLSSNTTRYIKQYFSFDDNKNKFVFELINQLINYQHIFNYYSVDFSDFIFVDSLKTLAKGKRVFQNGKINGKKTKS